jgi:hypothetical protein
MGTAWEDKYAIAFYAGIDTHATAVNSTFGASNGLLAATNGILLEEHPDLDPGVERIHTPKQTGLSEKRIGAG